MLFNWPNLNLFLFLPDYIEKSPPKRVMILSLSILSISLLDLKLELKLAMLWCRFVFLSKSSEPLLIFYCTSWIYSITFTIWYVSLKKYFACVAFLPCVHVNTFMSGDMFIFVDIFSFSRILAACGLFYIISYFLSSLCCLVWIRLRYLKTCSDWLSSPMYMMKSTYLLPNWSPPNCALSFSISVFTSFSFLSSKGTTWI